MTLTYLLASSCLKFLQPVRVVLASRGRGELAALAPRQRGRKPTPVDARDRKITELERQLAAMTGRAERAEALVDAQKNLAALLDRPRTSARS